jgi:hypothetical protein
LAGFRRRKDRLLSPLFDDYKDAQPSDRHERAWFRIETTAYQYFALKELKQTVLDHEARYCAISNAAQRARDTIEAEKARWVDHSGNELKAWLEGTKEFTEATEQYGDWIYIELEFRRKVDEAAKSLTELEAMANQLADELHKGRGRPGGTSDVPWNYFRALEEDYRRSTGLEPKMTVGRPYAKFVEEFLIAIGRDDDTSLHYDYAVEKRRDVRKHAGKYSGW